MKISELNSKTYMGAAGAKSKSFVLINYDDTATDSPVTSKISVENLAKEVAAELGLPKYDASTHTLKKITHDTVNNTYTVQNSGTVINTTVYPKHQETYGTAQCYPLVYNTSLGTAGVFVDRGNNTIDETTDLVDIPVYNANTNKLVVGNTSLPVGGEIPNDVLVLTSEYNLVTYEDSDTIINLQNYLRYYESEGVTSIVATGNDGGYFSIPVLLPDEGYDINGDTYHAVFESGGILYKDSSGDAIQLDIGTIDFSTPVEIGYSGVSSESLDAMLPSELTVTNAANVVPVFAIKYSGAYTGLVTTDGDNLYAVEGDHIIRDGYRDPEVVGDVYQVVLYKNGTMYYIDPTNGLTAINNA